MAKKQPAKKKDKQAQRAQLVATASVAVQQAAPFTAGYQAIPHALLRQPRDLPPFTFAIIHAMLIDPEIRLNLSKRAAPIAKAEFGYKEGEKWTEGIQCSDPAIGQYLYRQLQRIWNLYIPALLRSQVWGWSAGEITYRLSAYGVVEIDKMLPRHAADSRILIADKQPWGVRFSRIRQSESGQGFIDLQFPYCWFHSFNAEDGDWYGVSALLGCYSPWASKWFNGGALDVRQLFMHKDAYGGVDLGYPEGETLVNGQYIPNVMIARQIVEQLAAGGVTTRPSQRDQDGNEKWPLTRASVPANPQHILQYPKDLDAEIRAGLEVPEEDGDAWASKRVTMASFYSSLDQYIVQIVCDLKEQVFDNLCLLNFGYVPEYDIKHKPLAEQAMEQQANAGPGAQQGNPQSQGMGFLASDASPSLPLQPAPAVQPQPQVMSLEKLVGRAKEIVRCSVDGDSTRRYSCVMLKMPGDIADRMRTLAASIPLAALAEDGAENEPHITVKYGLVTNSSKLVEQVIAESAIKPFSVHVTGASAFESDEHDVVKLDIESDDLRRLNAMISDSLKCNDTYPDYRPHATLAYVKPGLGEYFASTMGALIGAEIVFDSVVFSNQDKEQFVISLAVDQSPPPQEPNASNDN